MTAGDRQRSIDRRQRPTPLFNRYFLRGRRHGPRRLEDGAPCYIDRPGSRWLLQLALLLVLGVIDIFATHYELQRGLAVEANPLMRWLLEQTDVWIAWGSKLLVTVAGGWLLLAHVRWRYARVGVWLLNGYYGWITFLHFRHFLH